MSKNPNLTATRRQLTPAELSDLESRRNKLTGTFGAGTGTAAAITLDINPVDAFTDDYEAIVAAAGTSYSPNDLGLDMYAADGTINPDLGTGTYDADGQLHSDNGPALIHPNGTKSFYQHGILTKKEFTDGSSIAFDERGWPRTGAALQFEDDEKHFYADGELIKMQMPDGSVITLGAN
ncbi:hypothetical protein [Leifsonia sp. Leaf264]|uniref:hypothetical protein n=1 Tax=Leifsonia sp. Leaf264 TaxID=1736314 RepID=UPI0006FE6EFF|nr:hypothetical protein [Leifsonia sp. Leaf264]KQO98142.1 hypothetical protein ASF30_08770 [Leifsonia sp. Leaf264]